MWRVRGAIDWEHTCAGELVCLRSAFVELPSLLGGRVLHHVHGFTDAQTLIRDVGEYIGNGRA